MASGIKRSKWTPKLAKALGLRIHNLRGILQKGGYPAPYVDEPRAMKLLESLGYSLKKYKPLTPEGIAYKGADAAVEVSTAVIPYQPGGAAPVRLSKLKSTIEKRLINRLAKLMVDYKGTYRKTIVRKMLTEGGYPGPKWEDEAKALAILSQQGVNIDNFEYLAPRASDKTTIILGAAKEDEPEIDPGFVKHLIEQNKLARMILESYAHHWKEGIKAGTISDFISPMEEPISALHVLRKAYKKK